MSIEWAAGLFEGEGFIRRINPSNITYEVNVKMTDRDIVERFIPLFGGSVTPNKLPANPKHKPTYTWRLTSKTAVRQFLVTMLPFFGHRRANQALNLLDYIEAR